MSEKSDSFIITYSGRKFFPFDPKIEQIDIVDIAHALSNLCRYNGHCSEFYSVAEHSILVSQAVSKENALWGLLHDAAEAYICDIPSPFKKYLEQYAGYESVILELIKEKFDLIGDIPKEVMFIDKQIQVNEMEALFPIRLDECELKDVEPVKDVIIKCWTPDPVKYLFLDTYSNLTNK